MIKVAIIIERADVALGGAERSISELTAELRRQGVAAAILAAKGTESESVRVLCKDTPSKRVRLNVFEKAIKEHLNNNHYDIIHSTLPMTLADIYQPRGGSYKEAMLRNIASYPFELLRTIKRRTHFLNVGRFEYLLAEQKLCLQECNTHIASLSEYVRKHFEKHYQISPSRISVTPNGVNPEFDVEKHTGPALKDKIYSEISVPNGQKPTLFLFAANNPRLKGLRSLLRAFRHIRDTNVYPVLVVAGNKGTGPYRNLIRQFGLQHQIVSVGSQNTIANAISVCDVAVLPTYYDPCSRFILEALAMGKPVITTAYNGAAERFDHLRHGYIIQEPDDYQEIAKSLTYFCDPENIELAHKAIIEDNLRQDVSIQKHVKILIELYHSILVQKRTP